jgi:hypothetical protein
MENLLDYYQSVNFARPIATTLEDKMTKVQDCILVLYSFIDGAHFFTSRDPLAKGLCVASKDLQAAFNEVSYQLKVLLKNNHNIPNPSPKSLTTFEELEKWASKEIQTSSEERKDNIFIPLPTAKMGWKMAKAA